MIKHLKLVRIILLLLLLNNNNNPNHIHTHIHIHIHIHIHTTNNSADTTQAVLRETLRRVPEEAGTIG